MINKMILQGRLVRDAEKRTTASNVSVANFTVAWNYKRNESESQLFLECVAWRGTADFVTNYFHKGQEIIVTGRLETQSWDGNDGTKRYKTILNVEEISFCGGSSQNKQTNTDQTEFIPPPIALDDESDIPF